ncbi:type II toxin-antitoxin system RelE family toxin [Isobaculum melis]|uniref:mRNA interferase RelE/StbE n=1 Tax=Isobaculum melis TaxID=142588 RepID=A0A1H9QVI9_9LACT|nr:type II toxin-antitoxin system RelE/ParE family toxin [Isobaculum melis]SER64468.1 mRNA interferase RelE/StbE [Isobaculum melis]
MKYRVETTPRFEKQLAKLDKFTAKMILKWLLKNIADTNNPKKSGKLLVGNHSGKWRYRVGDYRIICKIEEDELLVLALEVGHRKKIY